MDEFAIPGSHQTVFSRGANTTAPGYFARLQANGVGQLFTIAP